MKRVRQLGRSALAAAGLTLIAAAIAWTLPAVIPQPVLDRPETVENLSVRYYGEGFLTLDGETQAALLEVLSQGRCTRRLLWSGSGTGHPVEETISISFHTPGQGEAAASTELVLGDPLWSSLSRRSAAWGGVEYNIRGAGTLTRQVEAVLAGAAEEGAQA